MHSSLGCKSLDSRPGTYIAAERAPIPTGFESEWVQSGLNVMVKGKISAPAGNETQVLRSSSQLHIYYTAVLWNCG